MSLKDNLISTKAKITTIRDGLVQTLKDKNVEVDVNVTLSDAAKAVSSIKIGIDTSSANATSNDILIGKTAYVKGEKIEGNITSVSEKTYIPTNSDVVINSGVYLSGNQTIKGDSNLKSENIAKDITIFGITGTHEGGVNTNDATANSSDIIIGKTAYVKGEKIEGTLEESVVAVNNNEIYVSPGYIKSGKNYVIGNPLGESIYIPSNSDQIIGSGNYLIGNQIIKGDTDLISQNIKSGVSIFGVDGNFTSDANALSEDILKDKIAYVNGERIVGTAEFSTQEEIVAGYFVNNSDGTVSFHSLDGNNEQISEISIVDTGVDEPDYSSSQGGGTSVDVTIGQVDANGNFQSLSFNGTEASNSGNPETVEAYYGFNGVLPVPESGDGSKGCDFYKCASVDTVNNTWTGYKAVLTDGVYVFEENATDGLTYGSGFSPMVEEIYNSEATIQVTRLYTGDDPTLLFLAPLTKETDRAETGQSINYSNCIFTTHKGISCVRCEDGNSSIESDIENIPQGNSARTISFLACADDHTNDWMSFFVYGEDSPHRMVCVRTNQNRAGLGFSYSDHDSEVNVSGEWHHFAFTYNGTKARLLVDGVEVLYVDVELDTAYSPLKIGVGVNSATGYCGYISDFRIYNRVLTDSEIQHLASDFTPEA